MDPAHCWAQASSVFFPGIDMVMELRWKELFWDQRRAEAPYARASSSTAPRSGLSPLPATRPIWEHYGHLWKANDRLLCLACFIIAPLTVSVHPSCMLHSAAGRLEHPWKKKISQPSWIYYAPYRKMLNYSVWYELWREQGGYLAIFKAIVHTIVFILSSLTCPCVVSHLVRLRFEVKIFFVNVLFYSARMH